MWKYLVWKNHTFTSAASSISKYHIADSLACSVFFFNLFKLIFDSTTIQQILLYTHNINKYIYIYALHIYVYYREKEIEYRHSIIALTFLVSSSVHFDPIDSNVNNRWRKGEKSIFAQIYCHRNSLPWLTTRTNRPTAEATTKPSLTPNYFENRLKSTHSLTSDH